MNTTQTKLLTFPNRVTAMKVDRQAKVHIIVEDKHLENETNVLIYSSNIKGVVPHADLTVASGMCSPLTFTAFSNSCTLGSPKRSRKGQRGRSITPEVKGDTT